MLHWQQNLASCQPKETQTHNKMRIQTEEKQKINIPVIFAQALYWCALGVAGAARVNAHSLAEILKVSPLALKHIHLTPRDHQSLQTNLVAEIQSGHG